VENSSINTHLGIEFSSTHIHLKLFFFFFILNELYIYTTTYQNQNPSGFQVELLPKLILTEVTTSSLKFIKKY